MYRRKKSKKGEPGGGTTAITTRFWHLSHYMYFYFNPVLDLSTINKLSM